MNATGNCRQIQHSPDGHGHAVRNLLQPRPSPGGGSITPTPIPDPPDDPAPEPDPDRELVIEGNRAWAAAAEVRKRWLQQLFARRSAPREVARFVAEQLLTMPEPLRLGLGTAHSKPLFTEITGHDAGKLREGCASSVPARLPLLMLAPIAVAYEGEIYGADASRRSTWRTDKYSPCPRTDAGRYLTLLASLGYQMSAIEHAVADGEPYTGDTPASPDPADTGEADTGGADGENTAAEADDTGEQNEPGQAGPASPGGEAAA